MDFSTHKTMRDKALADKGGWNGLYDSAYRYAIPYRRGVQRYNQTSTAEIFDTTAPIGVMRFAGQLHQDLFPPGQPFFKLTPGALATKIFRDRGEQDDEKLFRRSLEDLSDQMAPHFMTGEFDGAIAEMCVDLAAGTGCLLPSPAEQNDPQHAVRFTCLPFDDITFIPGPFGGIGGLCWTTVQSFEAIRRTFHDGRFPDAFTKALADNRGNEDCNLYQDFIQQRDGTWKFVAFVDGCEEPVFSDTYKTRPFCSPRYFKVPGELYGRGPLLMSLGTIRTVNRAMELYLKSAALQMLGIWAYRPTSASPDRMPMAPGAFWPMQSTGGVMGPDVARLDTGGKELQIGALMLDELRTQIRAALHDDSIPSSGATPKSATEIMAVQARIKTNYLGAFGRLLHETVPDLVPRVLEILKDRRVISTKLSIDRFLTNVSVVSPLGNALRANALQSVFEYVQVVGMVEGPQAVHRRLKLDDMMDQIGIDMGIAAKYIRTQGELQAFDEQAAQQAAQAALAQSALDDPKGMAEAAQIATQDNGGKPPLQLVA